MTNDGPSKLEHDGLTADGEVCRLESPWLRPRRRRRRGTARCHNQDPQRARCHPARSLRPRPANLDTPRPACRASQTRTSQRVIAAPYWRSSASGRRACGDLFEREHRRAGAGNPSAAGEGEAAVDDALVEFRLRQPGMGEVGLLAGGGEIEHGEPAILMDPRHRSAAAPVGRPAIAEMDGLTRDG